MSGSGSPSRCAACLIPVSGERRFRSMSTASAFSGETYSTRQRRLRSAGGGVAASRSIAHRNAASVLPDPVGAMTSVSPSPVRRWRATPAPAPAWARRTRPRTTPASRPRTRQGPQRCSPGRCSGSAFTGSVRPALLLPSTPVCPHPPTVRSTPSPRTSYGNPTTAATNGRQAPPGTFAVTASRGARGGYRHHS